MTPPKTWTKDEIERFLAEERPRYQRIELPFGLATVGEDRGETARLVLPERLDGKSVLDVGCFLGYFSQEAKRRGAARVVGLDVNGERLRQARTIAEILGADVDLRRADVETDPIPGVFDVVLCLNVLHHLRNPFSAVEKLIDHTKERLVLEIAGLESPGAEATLDEHRGLRWFGKEGLTKLPLVLVGAGHRKSGKQPYFFTPPALENALLGQRRMVARVDVIPSPYRGRFIAVAWKRRIDDLIVVAGLPTTGKSQLLERVLRGELPEIGAALGVARAKEWLVSGARQLRSQRFPHVPAMAFHYDMMRGSALKFGSFFRDLNLDLLKCAERSRVAFLWVDPPVLLERMTKRAALEPTAKMREIRDGHTSLVADPRRAGALVADWHEWCEARGVEPVYVDTTAEPRLLTAGEFAARRDAAGWTAPRDRG